MQELSVLNHNFKLINNIVKVIIGHKINMRIKIASKLNKITSMTKSITINQNFINIPIPIENQIKHSRYSFLMGLKKVRSSSNKENCCKNALFKEIKYSRIANGASKNQKRTKIRGINK